MAWDNRGGAGIKLGLVPALGIGLSGGDYLAGTVGVGLRERKRLDTFYAIQSAARRLVGERGLDHVTVEEIAAAANVSTRTFFNYFPAKHGAVVDPPPHYREMMSAALEAAPKTEPPLRAFRIAVLDAFLPQASDQQQLAVLIKENPALDPRYRAGLATYEEIIIDWVKNRTGIDPVVSAYPQLLAATANAAVHLIVDRWNPATGAEGLAALYGEVFDLLENGLAPPGARDSGN